MCKVSENLRNSNTAPHLNLGYMRLFARILGDTPSEGVFLSVEPSWGAASKRAKDAEVLDRAQPGSGMILVIRAVRVCEPEDFKVGVGRRRMKRMAPRAGFEPATNRLTAGCSTTELPRNTCALAYRHGRGVHISEHHCRLKRNYGR